MLFQRCLEEVEAEYERSFEKIPKKEELLFNNGLRLDSVRRFSTDFVYLIDTHNYTEPNTHRHTHTPPHSQTHTQSHRHTDTQTHTHTHTKSRLTQTNVHIHIPRVIQTSKDGIGWFCVDQLGEQGTTTSSVRGFDPTRATRAENGCSLMLL